MHGYRLLIVSNPTDGMDQRQPGFLFPQSESMFAGLVPLQELWLNGR